MSELVSTIYKHSRRIIRNLVTRNPTVDRLVGRSLVQIDVQLQKLGIFDKFANKTSVECHGLKFNIRPIDVPFARMLELNRDYEPATREAILSILKPGSTFVDLGAHLGYFTMLAARQVGPAGRVYAFEPSPGTRQMLERNLSDNHLTGQVVVVDKASSDRKEQLRFLNTDHPEGNGVALPGEHENVITVEATSLDEYFSALGWPKVDLIKMDVEGQETRTLRGMKELIARNKDLKVIFEYHLGQIDRLNLSKDEMFSVLNKLGFRNYSILFRHNEPVRIPEQREYLDQQARRANLNILAEC
jgi:FkbM family methyltransferase